MSDRDGRAPKRTAPGAADRDPGALYHRAIVEAARAAVGSGRLTDANASATVDNPLCGDRVTIYLRVEAERVAVLAHDVRGCLLCEAAASLIGMHAPGQRAEALRGIAAQVDGLLERGDQPTDERWRDLAMFTPVQAFKSRHRCVRLPFEALLQALNQRGS
ncbi:MAG: iron-sulfur cluster assembly scaffold protein [Gammaproteobacteria bacterium]|nr:iron-sulfur cluster assembly scaffold protein [Gammaproteobacteria bacterium]NIR84926.1 iron-sulfur cluster assembly scaffold protein [Gammaproteobacteria bacterium]NIR91775.1 iron-sulfur cluster assembly scaffold protein [Gammaproteobacteria bacterium]NIU05973.1 iron-sulfur cluster assembly scaffold protein [Gammaproteobacteria bacterium]NIV53020.1 iron-sulfur cluster assembly scaffold protein [Gammaproteobacteria bacterium]